MMQPIPSHPDIGQLSYQLLYGEVLKRVLQQARDGLLTPHWRDLVATMPMLSGPDPMGVHPLIVTAINEHPYAAWEPGRSPGWREAVDNWFDDSRKALADHRRITMTQHAELTQVTALISVSARIAMAPSVTDAMAQLSSLDARQRRHCPTVPLNLHYGARQAERLLPGSSGDRRRRH